MSTSKPNLNRIWAESAPGSNIVDPDSTNPGKFAAGWLAEVPPFEHFNFLQNLFTKGLAHNNEQGINVWDSITLYPVDAIVKGSDGNVYRSLSEQSGNDPISSINHWVVVSASAPRFLDVVGLKSADSQNLGVITWPSYLNQQVSVAINNSVSNDGGANYLIVNSNPGNISKLIDGVWVGDNHDLGGGYYAKLLRDTTYAVSSSETTSPSPQQLNSFHDIGTASLRKVGRVLEPDQAKGWMNTRVESPSIIWDERDGKYHMVFTGYGVGSGQEQASIGHAVSDNLVDWLVDSNPLLGGTGVPGDPDEYGGTGPYLMKVDGTYYLFYIGLTEAGYEGGIKTLCLATKTSWGSPWVRRGIVIDLGQAGTSSAWRSIAIWHPTVHKKGETWYLFFNASGSASGASDSNGVERIGFATSPDLLNWTVDDENSPVINTQDNSWKETIVGDPSIYKAGDFWFMNYFGYTAPSPAADSLAWTTDEEFPLNWREYSAPYLNPTSTGNLDNQYAHKPFVLFVGGKKYHYYTAVNSNNYRTIALAVSDTNVSNRHYADVPIVSTRQTPNNSYSLDRYEPDNSVGPVFEIVHDANKQTYKIERANANQLVGAPLLAFEAEDSVLYADDGVFLKINNRYNGVNDLFINDSEYAYQLILDRIDNSLSVRRSTVAGNSQEAITWDERTKIWTGGTDGGYRFDSGWVPVTTNTVYSFSHGIGKTPTETKIQFSDTSDGVGIIYEGWGFVNSGWRFVTADDDETYSNNGLIKIRTGQFLTAGNGTKAAATHMRVLAK